MEDENAIDDENSESEFTLDRIELGTGWVCFQGGEENPPAPEQLPVILNDAITDWLLRNPEFKVRTTLPVVVDGNTIAINVWFD
jgi:hypothetical protein